MTTSILDEHVIIFTIGKGDTLPVIKVQCVYEDENGLERPFDLTGAVVYFSMREETPDGNDTGLSMISLQPAAVDDTGNGICHYQWVAGDTDVPAVYSADFRVVIGIDQVTFPNKQKLRVIVTEDAA